jgi:Fe-S cluster assembly protein SufD
VQSLKTAREQHGDLVKKHLGKYIDYQNETFTAFNTAFVDDGAFIFIPKNTALQEVVHIINLTDVHDESAIIHPRNLIVAEDGAEAEVVESFHALSENVYFNNLVTEVFVGRNARLKHIKLQEENSLAYHISNSQVCQQRDSNYTTNNIDLGGRLVRNNLNIRLEGENCESHLYGYYMGFKNQLIDNHTFIDHAMPNCFSNELYKGILDDKSQGVFNGKILVRQDAQKTNALQSNKTLLLTNEASVNAKPQLEIFADDVKCTHGATIGQLDDEALFYLRARGISEDMAGAMLRHAFVADVLDNIEIDSIRKKLDHDIIEKFTARDK